MNREEAFDSAAAPPGSPSRWFKRPCFLLGALIFVLALCLRLAYTYEYSHSIRVDYYRFDQTDNHTFNLWARTIAEGDWLCRNQIHPYHQWTEEVAPESQWLTWYGGKGVYHQAPLYPYIVGTLYALFGMDAVFVRLFQAILGACTALIIFMTARSYFGRSTGVAAGLLLALSGFHFYYDAFILRENLIAFLTAAFLLTATWAFKRKSLGLLMLSGMLLGLGVAAKPTAVLLLPFYLAAVFVLMREMSLGRRCLRASIFVAAFLLPLAPFYARNAALGLPLLKISTRGPTAYINGNLRGQAGVEWNPPAGEVRRILWNANYKLSGTVKETLKTYADNPIAYLELLFAKTSAFFNSYEIPNNTNYYLIRGISRTLELGFVSYWFMATAAILGMLLLLPRAVQNWQLYLIAVVLGLATIAFFIVARFRQPLVPLFAVFAGYTVVWVLKKIRAKRFAALVPALVAFFMILSWTDHDERVYHTDLGINTGVMLKLAALEDFTGAERYKNRLFEALHEQTGGRYYPNFEEKAASLDQAFADFRKSSEFESRDARRFAHMARGYLFLMDVTKRTQFQEYSGYVRNAAEEALRMEPELQGTNKTLGICLMKLAQQEEEQRNKIQLISDAMKHFRAELQLTPDDPECLKAIGFCFQAFGAIDEAIRYYKKYLGAGAIRDFEIESQIALLMISPLAEPDEQAITEALLLAEGAYRHQPDDPKIGSNYSAALHLAGRIDEAVAVMERMIALDPANADTYRERIEVITGVAEDEEDDSGQDQN